MTVPNNKIWADVAEAYIILGDRDEALKVLQVATSVSKEDWKVWDDLLSVAVDRLCYPIIIQVYERILELRSSFLNEEVLILLIDEIFRCQDPEKKIDLEMERRVYSILERTLLVQEMNPNVWALSAVSTASCQDRNDQNLEVVKNKLSTAYMAMTSRSDWFRHEKSVKWVVSSSLILADSYLRCLNLFGYTSKFLPLLSSADKSLQKVFNTVRDFYSDVVTSSVKHTLSKPMSLLEYKIAVIQFYRGIREVKRTSILS